MRGRIEKRFKSSYTIIIDAGRDPVTGKRIRVHRNVSVPKKKDAEDIMKQMIAEMDGGVALSSKKITVSELVSRWLETYAKPRLAAKTYVSYDQLLNQHIVPALGPVCLSDLKPIHLEKLYAELFKSGHKKKKNTGLSYRTVSYIHSVMHKMLDSALKWQLVSRNIADAVEIPSRKTQKKAPASLTEEQASLLLSKAKETPHYITVLLAVLTGMRRGEILALRWDDIDPESGRITVQRSLQYTSEAGLFFKEPKTGRSRYVYASPLLVSELKNHRIKQESKKAELDSLYEDQGLVICQPNGLPQHPDTITSWFPKFCVAIGLPKIRFHDLRHTHASLLLRKGINAKVVSDRLGHSGIGITMDVYSHILDDQATETAAALDDLAPL